MNKKFSTAIVIGGGAFGTSLAYILSDNFEPSGPNNFNPLS